MNFVLALLPTFLGFDLQSASADEIECYCNQIVELAPILRTDGQLQIFVGDASIAALMDCGRYPFPNTFRGALVRADLAHVFSPEDIIRILHKGIQQARTAEECFGVADILAENLIVNPSRNTDGSCAALVAVEEQALLIWAYAIQALKIAKDQVICYSAQNAPQLEISATVLAIEPSPEDGRVISNLAQTLTVVPICSSFADLLNAERAWSEAETAEDVCLALSVAAYQIIRAHSGMANWQACASIRVGHAFLDSLIDNSAAGTGPH